MHLLSVCPTAPSINLYVYIASYKNIIEREHLKAKNSYYFKVAMMNID